jgi:hypothetical protein
VVVGRDGVVTGLPVVQAGDGEVGSAVVPTRSKGQLPPEAQGPRRCDSDDIALGVGEPVDEPRRLRSPCDASRGGRGEGVAAGPLSSLQPTPRSRIGISNHLVPMRVPPLLGGWGRVACSWKAMHCRKWPARSNRRARQVHVGQWLRVAPLGVEAGDRRGSGRKRTPVRVRHSAQVAPKRGTPVDDAAASARTSPVLAEPRRPVSYQPPRLDFDLGDPTRVDRVWTCQPLRSATESQGYRNCNFTTLNLPG